LLRALVGFAASSPLRALKDQRLTLDTSSAPLAANRCRRHPSRKHAAVPKGLVRADFVIVLSGLAARGLPTHRMKAKVSKDIKKMALGRPCHVPWASGASVSVRVSGPDLVAPVEASTSHAAADVTWRVRTLCVCSGRC
jgi:hypothetical protein